MAFGVIALVLTVGPSSALAQRANRGSGPTARSAEVYTCGTFKNSYFDGYWNNGQGQGSTEGDYGVLQTRYGAVCDTNQNPGTNFTTAWVMIAPGQPNGGYVQSGFFRGYNQCTVFFAETRISNSYGVSGKFGTSCIPTDGSSHGYAEQYGAGCGCEYAKIDGTVWMTTSWNPFVYWSYPFDPLFFGEATYLESDMPGNSATPTNFSSLQGQNGNNNNFYNYGCIFTPLNNGTATRADGEAWYDTLTSCPSFKIYTDTAGH
jgi:hypothetical protein